MRSTLRRWCRVFTPYTASEADTTRFRVRQPQASMLLSPAATLINVMKTVVVVAVL